MLSTSPYDLTFVHLRPKELQELLLCSEAAAAMGVHLVVMGKLRLLAGGHSNWQLLASLLCPFALKLPFATAARLPTSCGDLLVSVRLFLFRLHRIFFDDRLSTNAASAQRRRLRWERALRLLHERVARDQLGLLRSDEEMLNSISMLAL